MREVLLTRRWLILTVVIVLAQPAFAGLGWWQWGRGSRTHDIQNLGYAFQWWSFGILAIGGWIKMLHDELKERDEKTADTTADDLAEELAPVLPTIHQKQRRRAVAVAVAQRSSVAVHDDGADEELAAYNAYLAWLAANPRS